MRNTENVGNNFTNLLITSICGMENIVNILSSVKNLNEFRPFTMKFHARC